jgi:hypothetical protein
MRLSVFVRRLPLFFVIAPPAIVLAQFQPPTAEELKMTTDPKAPGAAAVYLNVEETTDDPHHYQSYYARIKVLSEKGKELATVRLPYLHSTFKINDIKARTIHADGTVIPLDGKPEDLLISKKTSKDGDSLQVNQKVFTLPSVEVGSILEYRYRLDYDDDRYSSPTWEVQRPYFVHQAHYAFTPFKAFLPGHQNLTSSLYLVDGRGRMLNNLLWWFVLPNNAQIKADAAGMYNLELTDIPATPKEEWMPPIESFLYKVRFYYMSATTPANFWTSESKDWSKDVDHFAEPSKSIREAVNGLIAPGDSELEKAKKLYKTVQAFDNTDYSRKKSESEMKLLKLKTARHAEDTWSQKSGSSEDIALLYLAMLRAANLNAFATKVVNRERALFNISYLNFDQLDDTLIILNTDGKRIVLDPGEKMCPFQTVSWRHSDAGGVQQSTDGRYAITSTPQVYTDNKTVRIGDLAVDAQGAITGGFRIIMTGQQALYWRQTALRNDPDEVKKQFDRTLESLVPEGIEAHIDHFLALDDPDVNLLAIVNVHGTLGVATSKRLLLPGFFFETHSYKSFVAQEKRLTPVDMHYGEIVSDQVTYNLPGGFSVEGAPQNTNFSWPQQAIFITKSAAAPGKITIARMLSRAFTYAKPDEYQDLRAFYQKVAASDQSQLVLTAVAPAAKGN